MNYIEIMLLFIILIGILGSLFIMRFDFKRYGLLFVISLLTANLFCYLFTLSGFYSFPDELFNNDVLIPVTLVSTVFPFLVLVGVRYSPEKWVYKIPFYWGIVNLGVLGEVLFKSTSYFKFENYWDLWDSYTLWWIFLLLFEILGGKIIPVHLRKPIFSRSFRYGRWAWIVLHVIFILTIFLAGVYVGVTVFE